jgi:hypothetical protein
VCRYELPILTGFVWVGVTNLCHLCLPDPQGRTFAALGINYQGSIMTLVRGRWVVKKAGWWRGLWLVGEVGGVKSLTGIPLPSSISIFRTSAIAAASTPTVSASE